MSRYVVTLTHNDTMCRVFLIFFSVYVLPVDFLGRHFCSARMGFSVYTNLRSLAPAASNEEYQTCSI